MEAFSDGVLAIVITIMVLELKVPAGVSEEVLLPLVPKFLSYVLSFLMLAIYWNNHHHLVKTVKILDGKIMWANIHLLFWLSLFPFVTGWMGENKFASVPVATFGFVSLMSSIAYYILIQAIVRSPHNASPVARAIANDYRGKLSTLLYGIALGLAFLWTFLSVAIFVLVALLWLNPDRQLKRVQDMEELESEPE